MDECQCPGQTGGMTLPPVLLPADRLVYSPAELAVACCAPLVREPLSAGGAAALAAVLKALADPARLRLLSMIAAQAITGQVFHVWGGAINALHGWSAGELFATDERWDADALLGELVGRFPDGVSPPGMIAGMQAAGGRSLRTQ